MQLQLCPEWLGTAEAGVEQPVRVAGLGPRAAGPQQVAG